LVLVKDCPPEDTVVGGKNYKSRIVGRA